MVMYYTNRLSVQCPWKTCLQIRQSQHSLAQPAVFVLGTHKSSSALLLFMLLYIHFHYSNNCFWIRRFAIAKGKIIITIMKFILRTRSSKLHVGHRIKEYQCLNPHQALLWSTLLSSLPHTEATCALSLKGGVAVLRAATPPAHIKGLLAFTS